MSATEYIIGDVMKINLDFKSPVLPVILYVLFWYLVVVLAGYLIFTY